MQIRLAFHAIFPFELAQLMGMAVVHDNGLVISRAPQSGHQRAGDASAAEKDQDSYASAFHVNFAQAWSAASTSACTSRSVWAVEMIQCKPLEGVM